MQTFSSILSRYVLLLMIGCNLLSSCKPKDGDPGPIGPAGDQGAVGLPGAKGPNGNLLYKQGLIEGTITGVGKDGSTPINETFRFAFNSSNQPGTFSDIDGKYSFKVTQYDSLGRSSTSLSIQAAADFSTPLLKGANLFFYKAAEANVLKYLQASYSNNRSVSAPLGSIANLAYNTTTGLLTGNYTWKVDNTTVNNANNEYSSFSTTGHNLTVTGTFSLPFKKVTIKQ